MSPMVHGEQTGSNQHSFKNTQDVYGQREA